MSAFRRRRERLLQAASGFDNVMATNPKNLFYLTGFWGGGTGIVTPESTVLVTSVMEERRARETAAESDVIARSGGAEMEAAVKKILARGKTLTDEFDKRMKGVTVDPGLFLRTRRTKDAEETARITKASEKIDDIYEMLEKTIRPGVTEIELAAEVMKMATEEHLSPLAAEGSLGAIIIGSGENAAYPHAELTDRKVRDGDLVIADIFFRYEGYCSDCTRTYGVGKVSKERRDGYAAVHEAQLRGVELVKAGETGQRVHEEVRAVLGRYGLDKYFTHGTGHGVGIDIHELPSLGSKSADTLQKGDVVTVEPGIYVPDEYGVRIEDTIVIDGAARVLHNYTRELLIL